MSASGPNADLALCAIDVSSYFNNGHKVRKSNVMEHFVTRHLSLTTLAT